MARKKIREYDAKRLLKAHASRLAGVDLQLNGVQVCTDTDFVELVDQHQWLKSTPLVVKPDMLFGQRGKHGLVGLDLSFPDAEAFVRRKMNAVVEIGGCSGAVDTFLIEPFVPHDEEMYFGIQSVRDGWELRFSDAGGVEVEENWDRVRTMTLATEEDAFSDGVFAPLTSTLPLEVRGKVETFMKACFAVFDDLDFSLMEFNPFTLGSDGDVLPLDMRAELDDTAHFRNGKKWGRLDFPLPFGRSMTSSEAFVHELDEQTGASLKLSILNPKGHIWTMVAGGGASVIYADTVGDLGMASELGNYAEYSGAPNTKETYLFARTLVDAATTKPDDQPRALIVGGGIANFTDVAATFKGIIQAFRERADALKACQMRIYVRRGGPNYRAGLDAMRALGEELQLPITVHGPEASMTGICQSAIDYVSG